MADTPEAERPGETPADETAAAPSDDSTEADQLKDRFRAALDRKRGATEARSARGHGGSGSKVHERNRAGGKRTFRRKSG